jgi:hypothetical protein
MNRTITSNFAMPTNDCTYSCPYIIFHEQIFCALETTNTNFFMNGCSQTNACNMRLGVCPLRYSRLIGHHSS